MQDPQYAEAQKRAAALAAAPYGMFICSADGIFEAVNTAFEKLTGLTADEMVGLRTFESLHDPAELAKRRAELPSLATICSRYEGEWTYMRRNSAPIRVVLALAPVVGDGSPACTPGSRPERYVGIAIDMTRYAQSEARLWYVAHHDGVTRLPNQTLFTERLELMIARCERSSSGFTVLIAELDHLRKLRDALGLHAAELVLQIVGERLRGLFPHDGTIASIGGTQFALLINDCGPHADAFADEALDRIAESIDYGGTPLSITASIGIVAYPADGLDAPTLMRRAGVALSAASAVSGNAVKRFSAALEGQAARRFELETMLHEALERQQLHLVYQPQVTLATGRIAQVETLLRWNHPQRGLISPVEFVPVAEESGLIEQIGEWVIRTACRDAGKLLRQAGTLPRFAVNVSPQQFRRRDLFEMIREALEDAALDPSYLEVEITEGALLGDTEQALKTLHALRELGVEVAVDDFGTGYSSLAYLTRFPLNRLKIDRSFVTGMTTDPQSGALVGAIIAMAHALKLRVTAEGVETAEQAAALEALSCDEAQGFWFSRPITITALLNVLKPLGAV
ncbi:diguanylate cyclase/phosphodiesterase with PAS/PAC sensor(s) [Paraburkholderia fungorum]|uniref:Diguanylate cyclase/phosphodiesterase with PAS/PAC sensor(S) n=1 Tax=Paraburkholderia fungorum TaxID=134537 RepID=A0A1H1AJZ9_9BURK|nr:GGDEF domain-containing phosphodiesterase [Paraburkholderia fungorum]SDQ39962.1 diguanylate cyclase/phosphodiesterase with PAS/PAC sensor(s) [Paraburkholderia fungorum]